MSALQAERDTAEAASRSMLELVDGGVVVPDATQPLATQLESALHRVTVLAGLLRQARDAQGRAEHKLEARRHRVAHTQDERVAQRSLEAAVRQREAVISDLHHRLGGM